MLPSELGLADVLSKYCVVKLAVYVVAIVGPLTEWDCAPASDQLAYTYCVPVGPACGDVTTAMVWLVPGVQETLQGAVQLLPSTDSASPLGTLVTVIATGPEPPPWFCWLPSVKNVAGALALLNSVAIQSEERAALEILSSSIPPFQ